MKTMASVATHQATTTAVVSLDSQAMESRVKVCAPCVVSVNTRK